MSFGIEFDIDEDDYESTPNATLIKKTGRVPQDSSSRIDVTDGGDKAKGQVVPNVPDKASKPRGTSPMSDATKPTQTGDANGESQEPSKFAGLFKLTDSLRKSNTEQWMSHYAKIKVTDTHPAESAESADSRVMTVPTVTTSPSVAGMPANNDGNITSDAVMASSGSSVTGNSKQTKRRQAKSLQSKKTVIPARQKPQISLPKEKQGTVAPKASAPKATNIPRVATKHDDGTAAIMIPAVKHADAVAATVAPAVAKHDDGTAVATSPVVAKHGNEAPIATAPAVTGNGTTVPQATQSVAPKSSPASVAGNSNPVPQAAEATAAQDAKATDAPSKPSSLPLLDQLLVFAMTLSVMAILLAMLPVIGLLSLALPGLSAVVASVTGIIKARKEGKPVIRFAVTLALALSSVVIALGADMAYEGIGLVQSAHGETGMAVTLK